jgi:hypothetical protein
MRERDQLSAIDDETRLMVKVTGKSGCSVFGNIDIVGRIDQA